MNINNELRSTQKLICRFGFWSSLSTIFSSFLVSLPLGLQFISGSFSYTNFPSPQEQILPLTGNLFLSFSFLIMAVSIHHATPSDRRIFSNIGVLFAEIFAVLESMVSYTQLSFVIPMRLSGKGNLVNTYFFEPGNFQFVLEFYACSLLSASSFFLAFAFEKVPTTRWIKILFIIIGILGIPIALSINFPWLWFNIVPLWSISLPAGAILVARWFKNKESGTH